MKTAFLIGHNSNYRGAFSKYFGMREFDFYNEVADFVCVENNQVEVIRHNEKISGYKTRIRATANYINNNNFDLVIECHFNAFDKQANGCETLYYYASRKGKEYAKKFSELVNRKTGIKLRNNGLKALANRKDRGFASVYYPKPPTILIEPFFGDNIHDCKKIKSPENLANIINDFIYTLS